MTQSKTPPSLREQIIDAIRELHDHLPVPYSSEEIFDKAIMPVLQRAMNAGELLVGRNTKDRVPVHQGIMAWFDMIVAHAKMIQANEATISKRKALEVIYQFGTQAERAAHEARHHNEMLKKEVH